MQNARNAVEVRISVSSSVSVVSAMAGDPATWVQMPGADLCLRVDPTGVVDRYQYTLESGLPIRDHHGEVVLTDTGHGGTEVVFAESFRPRIWGTGGFLRGRRERVLIETARRWDDVGGADASQPAGPSGADPTT
ncbi:MAG: hypothetical protein ABI720_03735 [Actinomycetes bacterium]